MGTTLTTMTNKCNVEFVEITCSESSFYCSLYNLKLKYEDPPTSLPFGSSPTMPGETRINDYIAPF